VALFNAGSEGAGSPWKQWGVVPDVLVALKGAGGGYAPRSTRARVAPTGSWAITPWS